MLLRERISGSNLPVEAVTSRLPGCALRTSWFRERSLFVFMHSEIGC
ncbi:MAG: hypothetical protein WAO25_03450 [Bacillota bacterium]